MGIAATQLSLRVVRAEQTGTDERMNSPDESKKQALPKPDLRRAERLAAELRANLKKRKSAMRTHEKSEETSGSGDVGSGE